jgi:hypothetical protein
MAMGVSVPPSPSTLTASVVFGVLEDTVVERAGREKGKERERQKEGGKGVVYVMIIKNKWHKERKREREKVEVSLNKKKKGCLGGSGGETPW